MIAGRARELARIRQVQLDALAARGGSLVVRGSAGIGKSALLRATLQATLLVFTGSARSAGPAAATAARISDLHPEQVRPCVVVPEECDRTGRPADTVFVDTGRDAHRRYRAPAGGLLCLVRPDGHIGFRSESVDAAAVLEYLASFLSVPGSGATADSHRQRAGSR